MNRKQTILVTGASRGIGRQIALKLAAIPDTNLIITCKRNKNELNKVCDIINKSGTSCICYSTDLSISENVAKMFEDINSKYGGIDILINNAGISHIGLLSDMTDDEWHHVMSTNVDSVFYCCRSVIPYMVHNHNGRILNISSVWGSVGASMEVAYSASKGAINSFTKALAKELAPSGIQVNAIACGLVDTSMNAHLSPEEMEALYEEIPSGRAAGPDEIASFVYSVVTGSKYLTGQILTMDGAWI